MIRVQHCRFIVLFIIYVVYVLSFIVGVTMVVTSAQNQPDEDQVYDVVFVVEKTANLVPYLEELKSCYIFPTLE